MRGYSYSVKIGLLIVTAVICVGCGRPFDVNVGTDEPIQVDVNMEVHVYQHGGQDAAVVKSKQEDYQTVSERRRNRMEEVRKLKNNRLVGEDSQGLLSIRSLPAGKYGMYVKKTVDGENQDRNFLMKAEAEKKSTSIGEVRQTQWRHWQRKSFPGEWIQVEGDEPGTYRWEQKKGVAAEAEKTGNGNSGEAPAENAQQEKQKKQ